MESLGFSESRSMAQLMPQQPSQGQNIRNNYCGIGFGVGTLKGEGNTVLSTTGEPGTLKGTNPSVVDKTVFPSPLSGYQP